MQNHFWNITIIILCFWRCSNSENTYQATPKDLQIPVLFADKLIDPIIPSNNPQTVEGIALGKTLFFDTILSLDQTQSCASCHVPQRSFADESPTSVGVDGIFGNRNAMPIFNLAWNYNDRFNWDGSSLSLENQAIEPVENPIELHNNWEEVVYRLQNHDTYPELFKNAFNTSTITKELAIRAIAQFERTLISANSRFDKYSIGEIMLSPQELNGLDVFMSEEKGDCFHCHGDPNNPLWTDNEFHNNGLDNTFTDLGLGAVTGDPNDNGKFRTPSLRNLAYTAPFMHDGRFATLDEVINHYSEGLQNSATIDPLMKHIASGGAQLSELDKADLKAFLLSLSDESFILLHHNQ